MLVIDAKLNAKLNAANNIFEQVDSIEGEVYRQLENRKTFKWSLDNNDYFIKLHRGFDIKEAFKNYITLRPPVVGAYQEWDMLKACEANGIPSLSPVAIGAKKKFGFHNRSFLITKSLGDTVSLEELGLSGAFGTLSFRKKRHLLFRVARIVKKMHQSGIAHRDCYLCHFLLAKKFFEKESANANLSLIDLHRARQFKTLPRKWQVKDLSQLYFSSFCLGFSKHDYLRFLTIYFDLPIRELVAQHHSLLHKVVKAADFLYQRYHYKFSDLAIKTTHGAPLIQTRGQLNKLGKNPDAQYALKLNGMTECILVRNALRIRDGKRVVLEGTLRGRPVVVKLYYHRFKSYWHFLKERQGYERLTAASITTPRLFCQGKLFGLSAYALVFEKITDCVPHEHLLQDDYCRQFLQKLMPTLSLCAEYGIWQTDCHPNNYLYTKEALYSIDCSDIETAEISKTQELAMLTKALVQFYPREDSIFEEVLETYLKARQGKVAISYSELKESLHKAFLSRMTMLMSRVQRDCGTTRYDKSLKQVLLATREQLNDKITSSFINPELFFNANVAWLKKGNSASVVQILHANQSFMLKRYNIKSFFHGLKRIVGRSRAYNSWYYGHMLYWLGIPTPRPMACVENRSFGLRRECYLVTEFLEGETLDSWFTTADETDKKQIIAEVMTIFTNLSNYQIIHGDLKASNFFVSGNKIYLIDLDSARKLNSQRIFKREFEKDIARFLANWQPDSQDYDSWRKALHSII